MIQFLLFNTRKEANTRSRQLMDSKREPDNTNGDRKPYTTTHRHNVVVADDGQAMLEVQDSSDMTDDEKSALIDIRPSKFERPEETDE